MNVERVNGVDTQCRDFLGIFRTLAGRCGKNSYVHILELGNVVNHLIRSKFQRFVLVTLTAYDTCNLEIPCGFQCLNTVLTDIAIAHNGCSDLFHIPFTFYN